MRTAVILSALLALPAAAQTPAEALARLMMDACVFDSPTPAVDELMLTDAGFENTSHGDGTAEFAAPSGATLAYASREGFASCEMVLPGILDGFGDLAAALSAEIGARYEGAVPGQSEEGFDWILPVQDGAVTTTSLTLGPDGAATLVSATEAAR